MPRNIARREFAQMTGAAAVSLVPAIAWTSTATAAPRPDPVPATDAAAKPATLFPWIGM